MVSSVIKDNSAPSSTSLVFLSCLIALAKVLSTVLIRSDGTDTFALLLILEEAVPVFPLNMM